MSFVISIPVAHSQFPVAQAGILIVSPYVEAVTQSCTSLRDALAQVRSGDAPVQAALALLIKKRNKIEINRVFFSFILP